ncbi:thermostable hemolysin [Photobacterium galatheae]|uniref:Delta-VPH n=1 Tax=Photobacterium galatheae TaxID=1654360 RepID=A0A066RVV0_9GAMM|nr:thermostable hemolysin [Photobacterium galatheae]KDM93191.1 delta-VPH [Photobacterium galatheae]MCM0148280.1 thermostable hemolysin [Photobacterium galatheae]
MGNHNHSNKLTLVHIDRDHPFREKTERYIASRYASAFQARIHSFMPAFLALIDEHEQLLSVCGYQAADTGQLFLEQYLDQPAEQLMSERFGQTVDRSELIEFGQLAAFSKGMSSLHFTLIAEHLVQSGYHWCVFTATGPLQAMMRRLGLNPAVLAEASAERIPNADTIWGTYYQQQPRISGGSLSSGLAVLNQRRFPVRQAFGGQA